jgi:hypothetical protein
MSREKGPPLRIGKEHEEAEINGGNSVRQRDRGLAGRKRLHRRSSTQTDMIATKQTLSGDTTLEV